MKKIIFTFVLIFSILALATIINEKVVPVRSPDFSQTPGLLCSTTDADFSGLDYPESIARCNRHISDAEKAKVAARYGNIPRADWSNYEFDHLLPICAGGSNSSDNLWPEPLAEAKKKDILEVDICLALRAGTIKQADAVQKIYDWFKLQH